MKIVNDKALKPFRGPGLCEICRTTCLRQPHHIFATAMGAGSRIDHSWNIVAICPSCHRLEHDKNLLINGRRSARIDFFRIVGKREGLPAVELEHALLYFRNLSPKQTESSIEAGLSRMRPRAAKLVRVLLEARKAAL